MFRNYLIFVCVFYILVFFFRYFIVLPVNLCFSILHACSLVYMSPNQTGPGSVEHFIILFLLCPIISLLFNLSFNDLLVSTLPNPIYIYPSHSSIFSFSLR